MTKANSRNAKSALADLDESGITKHHRRVLLASGMGFFTDAYDLFIIGVALALVKAEWHPSTLGISLVSSTALLASAFGAIFFGRLADLWGRRRVYGLGILLLAGGAIATALSPNIWWLIGLRFIVGFGVGGDYPVSATIMSEYSGRRTRGRMVAMVFSMQALGLIVGPLVAVALLASGISHDLAWRIMLAFGAVPALLGFRLRRQIHETPRFALAAGDTAHAVLAARRATGGDTATARVSPLKIKTTPKASLSTLLTNRKLRFWLLGTGGAWFLLDFAFYGNTISSPLVLKLLSPHASLITTTLETLAIFVIAAAPGYVMAIWRIDTQGRKSVQSIGFAMMAICFLAIGLIPGLTALVLPFMLLYGASYFFTQYGPNTTTFVYPTELFPVRLRATSHGISAAAGKSGAFIGVFLFPIMLSSFGLGKTELVVAVLCVVGLVVTLALLPETKHESLEKISGELLDAQPSIVE
jgi:MFS transporter, PHS family, inorganic phosphate transporter